MGDIGSDGFLERRETGMNPTESMTVTTNVTTDSPESAKPPTTKAPGKVQTYSADPPTGVWHYLGDAERKGNATEEKGSKGKDPKGERPKGEIPK